MSHYVEYSRRLAGLPIVEQDTLAKYAAMENVNADAMSEVLTNFDRNEYYIKAACGSTIGSFFLTAMLDAHHGQIAVLTAHWIADPYRNNHKIHKLILWYVKQFCKTLGLRKYQRTVNLSSSRQLLITKEV
ncbi:hypothetical protein [Aeromonas phage JELG-KS1]|uniref:Uncharacterized protein n=1 Tax=Aeromonas phage JELG-KS1 TaxID=2951233 RepID=A0A9E7NP89_9CAUD|nr:hypothetical protein [Aeromonas phage JELG-KS1]